MRLTIDRTALRDAIATALPFAPDGRGLLAVCGEACSLSAGGPEGGVRVTLDASDCSSSPADSAAVPLPLLRQWLADSAAERVRVIAGRTGVVHGTDRERLEFALDDPLTVPAPEPPPAGTVYHAATAAGADFRRAVQRVALAASRPNREGRWAATRGVRVELGAAGLSLTATDGFQLAAAAVATQGSGPAVGTVPAATIKHWARLRADEVTLSLWATGASLRAGRTEAWTGLLAGRFPDLRRPDYPHALSLPVPDLARGLRMALAGADPEPEDETDPAIRFVSFRARAGGLTLRGEAGGGLSSAVELAVAHEGPDLDVTLDGFRLSQYLKAIAGEPTIAMRWETAEKPVEFAAGGGWYLTIPRATPGEEARAA